MTKSLEGVAAHNKICSDLARTLTAVSKRHKRIVAQKEEKQRKRQSRSAGKATMSKRRSGSSRGGSALSGAQQGAIKRERVEFISTAPEMKEFVRRAAEMTAHQLRGTEFRDKPHEQKRLILKAINSVLDDQPDPSRAEYAGLLRFLTETSDSLIDEAVGLNKLSPSQGSLAKRAVKKSLACLCFWWHSRARERDAEDEAEADEEEEGAELSEISAAVGGSSGAGPIIEESKEEEEEEDEDEDEDEDRNEVFRPAPTV